MGNAYTEAEVQSMLNSGELPELPCKNPKALKFTGDNLVFIHKKHNVTVPLNSIVSFTLKKPSFTSNSVIILQLKKGSDAFIGMGNVGVGFGSEMIAIYKPDYVELAEVYERYFLHWSSAPQPAPAVSEAVPTINDLRALKQLVDEGVLTEEEFVAKKRQLLGI